MFIVMISNKMCSKLGGCRHAKPCGHRPKPTTPNPVAETINSKDATTIINNITSSTASTVNQASTEQVIHEDVIFTLEPPTIMEPFTIMAPSTIIIPPIPVKTSTAVEESSEVNTELIGMQSSILVALKFTKHAKEKLMNFK